MLRDAALSARRADWQLGLGGRHIRDEDVEG